MGTELSAESTGGRYEQIGLGYTRTRREDPQLAARIDAALGAARTVVNVGAGTGSYEPADRHVIAIEPSDVMAAQRPTDKSPAIRARAEALPLRDRSVDAAMAILTMHHWDPEQQAGARELRRVARGPVVILTYDASISPRMWLMDYMPEVAALDQQIFPKLDDIAIWLGGHTSIEVVPSPRHTPDWTLGSFWAHPERVLDPAARAGTSGFARMTNETVERVVREVAADLESGEWDRRYGQLRDLDAYDVGVRLLVNTPA
jgi:SAM-dependent methyltransferase